MLCAYVAPLLFIVAVAVRCLWGAVRSLETATSLPLLRRGRLRRMLPLQVRSDGKQREGEGQRQRERERQIDAERDTDRQTDGAGPVKRLPVSASTGRRAEPVRPRPLGRVVGAPRRLVSLQGTSSD